MCCISNEKSTYYIKEEKVGVRHQFSSTIFIYHLISTCNKGKENFSKPKGLCVDTKFDS